MCTLRGADLRGLGKSKVRLALSLPLSLYSSLLRPTFPRCTPARAASELERESVAEASADPAPRVSSGAWRFNWSLSRLLSPAVHPVWPERWQVQLPEEREKKHGDRGDSESDRSAGFRLSWLCIDYSRSFAALLCLCLFFALAGARPAPRHDPDSGGVPPMRCEGCVLSLGFSFSCQNWSASLISR